MPAELRPNLRAEPLRTGLCTDVRTSALPSNVCTELWPLL